MNEERRRIAACIPHGEGVSLFDTIEHWDADRIRALSRFHQRAAFPFAENGVVSTALLIEYGAQAAAIHGRLCAADERPAAAVALLGAVKKMRWFRSCFDCDSGTLWVEAAREFSNSGGAIYHFSAGQGDELLAQGRLSLIGGTGTGGAARS